jgi:hypothetical protein
MVDSLDREKLAEVAWMSGLSAGLTSGFLPA